MLSQNPISNDFEIITSSYGEGLIGFKQTEYPFKRGYMDMSGRVVIKPKYSSVTAFKDGAALVTTTYHEWIIDKEGKVLHSYRSGDGDNCNDTETWNDQLGDAFDGQPDAYWNID